MVWQASYKAFGKATVATETIENNLKFSGQYWDSESGFHYNLTRYYDPEGGRYTQSDTIGLLGGLNTYAYANNNPIIYIDPTGEVGVFGAFVGTALGAIGGFSGAVASDQGAVGVVISTFTGAVVGGVVGAVNPGASLASGTAAAAITSAAVGASSNLAGQVVSITLNPGASVTDFSPSSVIVNGALGAAGGLTGSVAAPIINILGNTAFERAKPFVLENFLQPSRNDLHQCRL